jgi:putative transposase
LAHDGANRHDLKLLEPTLDSIPIERPEPTPEQPQGLCLDRGYDYDSAREAASTRGLVAHVRTRGEEIKLKPHTPAWRARRWVVEACHSWMNRNRGLLIRWSKKDCNHLALLMLASGLIAFSSRLPLDCLPRHERRAAVCPHGVQCPQIQGRTAAWSAARRRGGGPNAACRESLLSRATAHRGSAPVHIQERGRQDVIHA